MTFSRTDKVEYKRSTDYRERFDHLNWSMHNYLRITRILKCLGEFGFEYLKPPFIKFILREAIVERTLTRTLDSCRNYWIQVIKEDTERQNVIEYCEQLMEESRSKKKEKTKRLVTTLS